MLKGVGAATAAALVGGAVPASGSTATDGVTMLGDFESNLDGWRGDGETELGRVHERDRPSAVTNGQYGLAVTVDGGSQASIRNRRRVEDADFLERPYLFATVTPGRVSETESDVAVQFRLYYAESGLLDSGEGHVESAVKTVRPHVPSVLTWDTSSIASEKRANATRLEIAWYAEDHPPGDDSDVDGGGFDYDGSVVFDDVHLRDDEGHAKTVQLANHLDQLQFAFGRYRTTEVHLRTAHLEAGAFVFDGGKSVPYTVETLSDGGVEFVLDGVAYLLGGEWL